MTLQHYKVDIVTSDVTTIDLTDDCVALRPGGLILQASEGKKIYVTFDGSTPSSTNGIILTDEGINLREEYIETIKALPASGECDLQLIGDPNIYHVGPSLLMKCEGATDSAGRHTVSATTYTTSDATSGWDANGGCYELLSTSAGKFAITGKLNDFERMGSEDWAFGCHIKYETTSETNTTHLLYVSSDATHMIDLYINSGQTHLYAQYINGATTITFSSEATITRGKWSHIEFDYDYSAGKFYTYCDGELAGTDTIVTAFPTCSDATVEIGVLTSCTSDNFFIDNVGFVIGRQWSYYDDTYKYGLSPADYPHGSR